MMLAPSGSDAELAALATESEGVEAMMQSAEWEQLKERLSVAMQESGSGRGPTASRRSRGWH